MSTWTPAPNPGGSGRELVRKVTAQWYESAAIPGVGNVYPGQPMEELFDDGQPGPLYRCNLSVYVSEISDDFRLQTGADDPGGYFAHYEVMLTIKHLCTSVEREDWPAAEDDHDRILDACKDRVRGQGRAMGRPDVILQAGAWPAQGAIRSETDEPVYADGQRSQWSRIFFTVTQYRQRQP